MFYCSLLHNHREEATLPAKKTAAKKPVEPQRPLVWMAYIRHHFHGAESEPTIVIKAPGEDKPKGFGEERPATKAEIAAERSRRAAKQAETERREAFRNRPEFQYADSIRSAIECMDHQNHPLDRLTLPEWIALHEKICG